MQTRKELKTAQGYLDAADREFEKGDALAGTERLWAAMTHTLTTVANEKGWAYDTDYLFPLIKKLAGTEEQVADVLEGIYLAAKGHPRLVSAEYFRFEYGDTHRARRMAREFIDAVLALAAQSSNAASCLGGDMLMHEELKTAQDYLDAADREFEKGDALAGTERLWAAMTHTLKGVAVKKGWAYDADDLYPVVGKIAKMDGRLSEMLFSSYGAAEGYPNLVRAGYLKIEDGDTHWARRVVHEFIDAVQKVAG